MAARKVTKSAWPDWQHGSSIIPDTLRYDTRAGGDSAFWEHESEPGHSTTTFGPSRRSRSPKRTVGAHTGASSSAPTSPRTQQLMLKHRASALIQKYSGPRWREAQRTKWLLDLVFHIDQDYRQHISQQAAQIAALNDQIEHTTGMQVAAAEALQTQNERLRRRVGELEQQLRLSQGALLDMQNRIAASEVALNEAEEASRSASEECYQLQQAVAVLAEHDASARKLLANRTHVMKEALLASRGRVRQAAENSKRHRLEVAEVLAQQRQRAEADRTALTAQVESSLAAANTLLETATRLDVDRLRLELEAYKEPWTYAAGDKSPTRRKDLTKRLGLKQKSMNVQVPF